MYPDGYIAIKNSALNYMDFVLYPKTPMELSSTHEWLEMEKPTYDFCTPSLTWQQ